MKAILYAIAFTIGLIAGVMILALVIPAKAMEVEGNEIRFSPEEMQMLNTVCREGPVCTIVNAPLLAQRLRKALDNAKAQAKAEGCRGT